MAPPETRIEFRDPIARHGEAAITAVERWVSDSRLGRFAVGVIEATVRFGVPATFVAKKLAELTDTAATPEIAEDIDAVLRALGARPRHAARPPKRPPGAPLINRRPGEARRYMKAWTYWHLVDGSVERGAGRLGYLSMCHRWNSESFIGRAGLGIRNRVPEGEHLCDRCNRADFNGFRAGWQTKWTAETAAVVGGSPSMYLWCAETRHIAVGDGALESAECGNVYMTECGWWIERDRVTTIRSGPSAVPLEPCEACARFVSARESAALGICPNVAGEQRYQ